MHSVRAWLRRQSSVTQFFLILGLAGYFARLLLVLVGDGSTDFEIWKYFGKFIAEHSLSAAYVQLDGTMPFASGFVPVFNHPPIPALLAALWFKLSVHTGVRFSMWLKLPGLVLEGVSGMVLGLYWGRTKGSLAGAKAWAAYGWSLCSILVSGYHGNTDAACAGLCLVAVYLMATRGLDFWGGLTLAAAINVKLPPVLLILPLLAHYRSWNKAARFMGGLATGLLPFVPVLLTVPRAFLHNVIRYVPQRDYWGVQAFLLTGLSNPRFGAWAEAASERYMFVGRTLISVLVLGLAAAVRLRRSARWSLYEVALLTFGLFMLVTPGFGVQYVVLLSPLFFAVDVGWASLWAWLSGVMLVIVYASWFTPGFPWTSIFHGGMPFPGPFVGVLAWGALGAWTVSTLWRRGPRAERLAEGGADSTQLSSQSS